MTKMAKHQKKTSKINKSVVFAAVLACLIIAGTGSAFSQRSLCPPQMCKVPDVSTTQPILRVLEDQTFVGQCCFSFGESVGITEPATIKPVIVTWSSDYAPNSADAYFVGLSVNGGECTTVGYGARVLADNTGPGSTYSTAASFQWMVLPKDRLLVTGSNTFELCGGGKNSPDDSLTIGLNTLAVQLAK
jgi:hypothetical protein